MKAQIWVGESEPTADKLEPIENRQPISKPGGGLWTSPERDSGRSAWIEWMEREHWCNVEDPHVWRLHPTDDAEVLEIESVDDLRPYWAGSDWTPARIDWVRAFEDYDALHLTERGAAATRFTDVEEPDLYGWDAESVLWDGWFFDEVEALGSVEIDTSMW